MLSFFIGFVIGVLITMFFTGNAPRWVYEIQILLEDILKAVEREIRRRCKK